MDKEKNAPAPDGADEQEHRRESEQNRREMDEVPEPGTDPLHEGP